MKFTVSREAFLKAFSAAENICPNKTDRPCLHAVRATVDKTGCTLEATDLENCLTVSVAGVVDKPGQCLLPVQTTSSIFRESRCDQMVIEAKQDGQVTIISETGDWTLQTEGVHDFPPIRGFSPVDEKWSTVPSLWLREALRRTIFATDPNNTSYALGGVCIEFTEKGRCYVAGTDARRISVMSTEAQAHGGHKTAEYAAIIPQKAAKRIWQALDEMETNCDISITSDHLSLRCGTLEFHASLLAGRFPQWRRAIEACGDSTALAIPAGILCSLMRQAMIVTSKETRGLVFEFTPSMLKVSSAATERGKSGVQVPIVLRGDPLTLEVNGTYIQEFAALLKPEVPVTIEMKDHHTAVLFSTEDGQYYTTATIVQDEAEPEAKPEPAKKAGKGKKGEEVAVGS